MPKKVVADWVEKGWTALTVAAGSSQSAEVPLPSETDVLVVKGQVYKADGETQVKGRDRPNFSFLYKDVSEDEDAVSLVFTEPTTEEFIFLYKIVSDDEEADD